MLPGAAAYTPPYVGVVALLPGVLWWGSAAGALVHTRVMRSVSLHAGCAPAAHALPCVRRWGVPLAIAWQPCGYHRATALPMDLVAVSSHNRLFQAFACQPAMLSVCLSERSFGTCLVSLFFVFGTQPPCNTCVHACPIRFCSRGHALDCQWVALRSQFTEPQAQYSNNCEKAVFVVCTSNLHFVAPMPLPPTLVGS
jgi:hypothetical protein